MKRLLLTLLGVAALCGLSPHPATAQETNDDAPLKKTISFSRSPKGDKIYYKNPTSGEWEEKGSAAFKLAKTKAQGTEFIKVGDIIFEICKTSTCGTNVLEVATDTTRALGLYIGTNSECIPTPKNTKWMTDHLQRHIASRYTPWDRTKLIHFLWHFLEDIT